MKQNDEKKKAQASAKLSEQQIKFIQNYARTFNGTKSAEAAGRKGPAAHQWATDNLRKPAVQEELQRLALANRKQLQEERAISVRDLQRKLVRIIGLDIGDYVEWGRSKSGLYNELRFAESRSLGKAKRRLIKKVSLSAEGSASIEIESKLKAIELLGRSIGMFDQDKDGEQDGQDRYALRSRLSSLLEES